MLRTNRTTCRPRRIPFPADIPQPTPEQRHLMRAVFAAIRRTGRNPLDVSPHAIMFCFAIDRAACSTGADLKKWRDLADAAGTSAGLSPAVIAGFLEAA